MAEDRCTIEVVTTSEGLALLGPVWDRLVARAGVTHPFVTHAWIQTWWECFGADAELFIIVVRAGAETIAIAPLMRVTERIYGARHRCLRFVANDHTPRSDFIVADGAAEAYAAICQFLMRQSADWDVLQLRDVPCDSLTSQQLKSHAAEYGYLAGVRASANSPFLPMTAGWDSYLESLPPKRRWFLRNRLKRLAKTGAVSLETVTGGSDLMDALEDGFRLEGAAWKGEAGTAIQCQPEIRRFYTDLAVRAADRGWLRLQFLKVDDRRVAFAYCLAYAQRMFLLKPGFDPDYAAFSPGTLLCYLTLQDLHASGFVAYDFLGHDDHWKRQWASESNSHSTVFLYAKRPLTRVDHFTRFALMPRLRQAPFYAQLREFFT
ncbi:MAG TPA: GNAT family N-acetyltransferase [Thermoanaerobaculia bacterium]|jgi:CelD/BcsL family acetyltransferase involved in cellulose biosynthesis